MSKWWQRSNTAEIKPIPWLSPAAILRLESLLTPDMRVLEHGSGGSTLWLASRVHHVISYEINDKWFDRINELRPYNVSLRYAREWCGSPDDNCDILLIDGEPLEDRCKFLAQAPKIVKAGGIVILDNANRPQYAAERKALQEYAESYEIVDANEPGTSFLVTDFYRLP